MEIVMKTWRDYITAEGEDDIAVKVPENVEFDDVIL